MDITLVTSSFNDEVHGTSDDKKTGCGINLLKPENVTKYRRGSTMTDLKEITCEKCKEKLAKMIIKADKKEMARILKEEKARAKRGLEDEGIVPLGNTQAKITKSPEEKRREEEAAREAEERRRADAERAAREAEEARKAAEAANQETAETEVLSQPAPAPEPAPVQRTIPGTGVPMDDSLAAFAINVQKEEPEPEPEAQDDFLAQFAVQKPEETVEEEVPVKQNAPQSDDFLAQFAIPSPEQQNIFETPQPAYEEPEEMADISLGGNQQQAAPYEQNYANNTYEQPPVQDIRTEEDLLKMFSVNNQPAEPAYSGYATEPVSQYAVDTSVIDVEENELAPAQNPYYAANNPYINEQPVQPQYGQPAYEQPVQPQYGQPVYEQPMQPQYGQPVYEQPVQPQYGQPVYEQPMQPQYGQPVYEQPVQPQYGQPVYEQPVQPQYGQPVYEQPNAQNENEWENVASQVFGQQGVQAAPVLEDIAPVPPVLEDIAPVNEAPAAPVLEDIAPAYEAPAAPVLEDIAPVNEAPAAPVLEDIAPVNEAPAAPVLEDIAPAYEAPAAPVLEDIAPVNEAPAAPVLEDISSPEASLIGTDESMDDDYEETTVLNESTVEGVEDDMNKYRYSTPVFADEIRQQTFAPASAAVQAQARPAQAQPIPQQAAPVQPQVRPVQAQPIQQQAAPVQPQARPVQAQPVPQQAAPAQPQARTAQAQPTAPASQPKVAPQMPKPQVISVPQFAGYDQNGQPVYNYVQMQMTGLDQNGQPIFAPLPGQKIPAPAPQAAAPQAAPVNSPVPKKPKFGPQDPNAPYTTPTANISKIAVNPHSKSTSQSFINAIASSKDYANKNLIETQGLHANSPILTSVEDVLSTMGDNSAKEKMLREQQKNAQTTVSGFKEYKGPTSSSPSRPTGGSSMPSAPEEKDIRFMTKSELKAKKKQDKIDAKFRKDMAKRGL